MDIADHTFPEVPGEEGRHVSVLDPIELPLFKSPCLGSPKLCVWIKLCFTAEVLNIGPENTPRATLAIHPLLVLGLHQHLDELVAVLLEVVHVEHPGEVVVDLPPGQGNDFALTRQRHARVAGVLINLLEQLVDLGGHQLHLRVGLGRIRPLGQHVQHLLAQRLVLTVEDGVQAVSKPPHLLGLCRQHPLADALRTYFVVDQLRQAVDVGILQRRHLGVPREGHLTQHLQQRAAGLGELLITPAYRRVTQLTDDREVVQPLGAALQPPLLIGLEQRLGLVLLGHLTDGRVEPVPGALEQ